MSNEEARSIVAAALNNGWAHKPQPKPSREQMLSLRNEKAAMRRRELRAKYKAMGLTTGGTVPKNRRRNTYPELIGLTGEEYRRAYHRIWMRENRKAA